MNKLRTLDDFDIDGKCVLVRVDFNVPIIDGQVVSDERVRQVVPTIQELISKGAKILIASHLGRPGGKQQPELSMFPLRQILSNYFPGVEIKFVNDVIGAKAISAVDELQIGQIVILENLRFEPGEELNDHKFGKKLSELADFFVNDAFSCAHRAHASITAVARHLPSCAGRLMEQEINILTKILGDQKKPFGAVIGGSKVSNKLKVLGNLVNKVQYLAIGGAMANTFLYAQGFEVGRSLCEPELEKVVLEILNKALDNNCEIVIPIDVVLSSALKKYSKTKIVKIGEVPPNQMIFDVGPASLARLSLMFEKCRTILWNGPLGAFEIDPFADGTIVAAQRVAELTAAGTLTSVAGGGDTIAALEKAGVIDDFSYVSMAGGAFLEWLEGKTLPGVKVLEDV